MWKLGLILLIAGIHTSSQCNISDYVLHGQHDHRNAVRICAMGEKRYNQLMIPSNRDEMIFYSKHIANYNQSFWIGIHNLLQPGEFVTLHGERLIENDYFRWAPGHPLIQPNFECITVQPNGLLRSDDCRVRRYFVCKRMTFGRNWMQFKSDSSIYNNAIINCALEGGQLMSPHTQDEFNTIYARAALTNETYWLGINDIQNEGDFINHDGVSVFPSNFLVWAPGRPQHDTSRNCIEIRPDGLISDEPCSKMLKYHCNK